MPFPSHPFSRPLDQLFPTLSPKLASCPYPIPQSFGSAQLLSPPRQAINRCPSRDPRPIVYLRPLYKTQMCILRYHTTSPARTHTPLNPSAVSSARTASPKSTPHSALPFHFPRPKAHSITHQNLFPSPRAVNPPNRASPNLFIKKGSQRSRSQGRSGPRGQAWDWRFAKATGRRANRGRRARQGDDRGPADACPFWGKAGRDDT